MQARLLVDCANQHGEGVLWSAEHGLVMWTDIHGERVWSLDPATGATRSYAVPGRVCCFAPRAGRAPTGILAGFAEGIAFLDLDTGRREDLAAFEPDLPQTRLNDGRTDRQGRFVLGGMDERDGRPVSSVARVDADGVVTTLFDGVACANSTCFSPDGSTLYFADSLTRRIEAFAYDQAAGTPGQRRTLVERAGQGVPDGSCVDAEGFIWNAVWDGGRVERWSPEGRLAAVIELPVARPTCCAFGGPDLATLYITTSRLGLAGEDLARQPAAGSLFIAVPGVRGVADTPFAG
ncbi:SMP-30/gluconolactonase/LRE family protein [Labrys wisconsinensis]|uniref:L-arabinonolactonase n=1 Tax=Labrys wisconsinensis TaxID=425677 RepID=A0ABU0J3U0_9HYPH|nr:SMP-30/gluconolactonase/LRE family protein [Labrys wisconsinensis]MDQ0468940.1 L-arabinonolactonase [Labrys wisconsinensis]